MACRLRQMEGFCSSQKRLTCTLEMSYYKRISFLNLQKMYEGNNNYKGDHKVGTTSSILETINIS